MGKSRKSKNKNIKEGVSDLGQICNRERETVDDMAKEDEKEDLQKSKNKKIKEDVSNRSQICNHERETVEDMAKDEMIGYKKLKDENEKLKMECEFVKRRNEELELDKKRLEKQIQELTVANGYNQTCDKHQENIVMDMDMESRAKKTSGQVPKKNWDEFQSDLQRSSQDSTGNRGHCSSDFSKESSNYSRNRTYLQGKSSWHKQSDNPRTKERPHYPHSNSSNNSNTFFQTRRNMTQGFGKESKHVEERQKEQEMKSMSWDDDEDDTYKKQTFGEGTSDNGQRVLEEEDERSVNNATTQKYNERGNWDRTKLNRRDERLYNQYERAPHTTRENCEADYRNRHFRPEQRRSNYQGEARNKSSVNKKVTEVNGDLFEAPKDHSLAHCVAVDMRMGSGIAVQFKQQFKRVDELLGQRKRVGEAAILEDNGRYIYYLVTKKQSTGKPTMETLEKALQDMKKHVIDNNVKHIAIPRLGCGLDRLDWRSVRYLLENIFEDTDVIITAYNFTVTKDNIKKSSLHIVEKTMKLVDIDRGTLLVFFGTECGFVNDAMEEADDKFRFIQDYKQSPKKLGEVLQFRKRQEIVCILIVKRQKEDLIFYNALFECLLKLKKTYLQEKFSYLGFSAFIDGDDDLTVAKIVTSLKIIFANTYCEAWICWPSHLEHVYKELTNDYMSLKTE